MSCGDITGNLSLKNRPKIYGRYLQFRILEWPLMVGWDIMVEML